MEFVRARLGGHDDLAAGRVAVLGREDAGEYVEFLDRVDRWAEVRDGLDVVVVVHSIEDEIVAAFARSRDVESAAIAEAGVLNRRKDACRQRGQRPKYAA